MPAANTAPAAGLTWCGHTGRYTVTAILCGPRGYSDRLMDCATCGRSYLASELAELRAGFTHRQPRTARPARADAKSHPAQERAGAREGTGSMSAPTTGRPPKGANQRKDTKATQPQDLGEGQVSGNLTDDPELRFTPTGRAVANLRVAYTPRLHDPDTNRWTDGETEFYTVIVWGQQGERCAEHLQRGDRIVAAGTWAKRTWEDRQGDERESIELTARDVGPSLLFKGAKVVRARRSRERDSDG